MTPTTRVAVNRMIATTPVDLVRYQRALLSVAATRTSDPVNM
jgi:hypothetical protein